MTTKERIENIVAHGKSIKLPPFEPKEKNCNAADVGVAWPTGEMWNPPTDAEIEQMKAQEEAYTQLVYKLRQRMIGQDPLATTIAVKPIESPVCPHCGK
jgi:hypothetical protein